MEGLMRPRRSPAAVPCGRCYPERNQYLAIGLQANTVRDQTKRARGNDVPHAPYVCPQGGDFHKHIPLPGRRGEIKRGVMVGCWGVVGNGAGDKIIVFFDDDLVYYSTHYFGDALGIGAVQGGDDVCGKGDEFGLGQVGGGNGALVFELADFGDGTGALVFEFVEFIEQGLAAATFGDGAGDVDDLAAEFFSFITQGFETLDAPGFTVVDGLAVDFEHGGQGVGLKNVVAQGGYDGRLEGVPPDTALGAARATAGAAAAIGFVAAFLAAGGSVGAHRRAAGSAVDEAGEQVGGIGAAGVVTVVPGAVVILDALLDGVPGGHVDDRFAVVFDDQVREFEDSDIELVAVE